MIQQKYYLKRLELFNYMIDFKNLLQKLIDLDKKTKELDEILKDVRIETENVFWELAELKIKKRQINCNNHFSTKRDMNDGLEKIEA